MVEATERELDERGGERRKRMMKTIMEKGSRNGRGRKEERGREDERSNINKIKRKKRMMMQRRKIKEINVSHTPSP